MYDLCNTHSIAKPLRPLQPLTDLSMSCTVQSLPAQRSIASLRVFPTEEGPDYRESLDAGLKRECLRIFMRFPMC